MYNTEKDLEDLFLTLPIDVRIIGVEYRGKEFTAKDICKQRDIVVIYNKRDHSFSSTDLRKRTVDRSLFPGREERT
jgi:glycerol-3-phosphate cytidylyltransferase